jgi:hypothetical protein
MTAGKHELGTEELLALLRDASLRPESICEEIECAGSTGCSAAAIAEARGLLAALADDAAQAKALVGLPELLGGALLRAAGEAGHQALLVAVASGPHKGHAKEAKRELQRLKQRGVKVADLAPQGAPVVRSLPEEEVPACYASSIDAYGERAVWFARPGRSGIELAQVVFSDVKGILAADPLVLSRKQHREFVKKLPRGSVVTVVEVSPAHARQLVAEAEAEGARNGFSPPASYARALRILGAAPEEKPQPPAAGLDYGPDGELPHQLAGAALFTDPLFLAWIPEEEALRAFAAKADEIAQSRLYADEAQRQEARAQAVAEASAAYFNPARRARYARRLHEMAHVLSGEGRLDAARTALATARALDSGGPAEPFCHALFTHALELTAAQRPAAAASPGLLAP